MICEARQRLRGQIIESLALADALGLGDVGIALDRARVAMLSQREIGFEALLLDDGAWAGSDAA